MMYLTDLFSTLWVQMIIMIIFVTLVILAMAIDLIVGIRKSKRSGHEFASSPLKRTASKFLLYVSTLILASSIDIAQMIMVHSWVAQHHGSFPLLPVFSFAATALLLTVEIKSVLESAEAKEKARLLEVGKLYFDWAKNHKTEFKAFSEAIAKKQNNNEKD